MITEGQKKKSLERFLAEFSDGHLLTDLGPALTCGECEALANLLHSHGRSDSAICLRLEHALVDDTGDNKGHLLLKTEHQKKLGSALRTIRAQAGSKGGVTTGKTKTRTREHYQRAARIRWARKKAA